MTLLRFLAVWWVFAVFATVAVYVLAPQDARRSVACRDEQAWHAATVEDVSRALPYWVRLALLLPAGLTFLVLLWAARWLNRRSVRRDLHPSEQKPVARMRIGEPPPDSDEP